MTLALTAEHVYAFLPDDLPDPTAASEAEPRGARRVDTLASPVHVQIFLCSGGAEAARLGDFYTNSIEGFWSLLKRQIIGIHHFVSAKHLH